MNEKNIYNLDYLNEETTELISVESDSSVYSVCKNISTMISVLTLFIMSYCLFSYLKNMFRLRK